MGRGRCESIVRTTVGEHSKGAELDGKQQMIVGKTKESSKLKKESSASSIESWNESPPPPLSLSSSSAAMSRTESLGTSASSEVEKLGGSTPLKRRRDGEVVGQAGLKRHRSLQEGERERKIVYRPS